MVLKQGDLASSLLTTAAILFCLLAGCGDGQEYETVSYAPVVVDDPYRKVEVSDAQAGAPPGAAPTFAIPLAVQPKAIVEFVGRFRPKEPDKISYMTVNINANIYYKNGGVTAKTTFVTSTPVMPKEDKGGYWSYRIQVPAPQEPRDYDVEILHCFEDLVATGTLKVE